MGIIWHYRIGFMDTEDSIVEQQAAEIKRYQEVINDQEYLNYITKNQLSWSENNIINDSKEKLTFDLLELNKWI